MKPSSSEDFLSDESNIGETLVLNLITGPCQRKYPNKKATKPNKPLNRESRMNVEADGIAFDTTQIASEGPLSDLPPVMEPLYTGTKAMLK